MGRMESGSNAMVTVQMTMGLNPFSLHDAIYLYQDELGSLEEGFVGRLFWKVFDATTEEEVRRALEYKCNE